MQCLNPIIANVGIDKITGKNKLSNFRNFKKACDEYGDSKMLDILKEDGSIVMLPCRKCVNCQLNRSREWAIRNSLEAREYSDDSKLFITLTYNNDSLLLSSRRYNFVNKKGDLVSIPKLNLIDVQKFLKRLRKKFSDYKIRFYLCGEYGGQTCRPHYHILLYGLPLKAIGDLDFLYETKNGKFYNSKIIEDIWNLGFVNITTFSDYTAMYVSRYCTKKQEHNYSLNYCFENITGVKEFNTMSRRPGIAGNYIIKHFEDVYKYDEFLFHIDDKTLVLKPLKFFDRKYDIESPDYFKFIKDNRKAFFSCYDYFRDLENNYSISEYLHNIEEVSLNKIKKRSN